jgi:hypothetical protein
VLNIDLTSIDWAVSVLEDDKSGLGNGPQCPGARRQWRTSSAEIEVMLMNITFEMFICQLSIDPHEGALVDERERHAVPRMAELHAAGDGSMPLILSVSFPRSTSGSRRFVCDPMKEAARTPTIRWRSSRFIAAARQESGLPRASWNPRGFHL